MRAASMAVEPPPTTTTSSPIATFLPKLTSRRKSIPERTPLRSLPSMFSFCAWWAPLPMKTAAKPFFCNPSTVWTGELYLISTPALSITAISACSLSLGRRKSGMPTFIMPPATFSASKTTGR